MSKFIQALLALSLVTSALPARAERWVSYRVSGRGPIGSKTQLQVDLDSVLRVGEEAIYNTRVYYTQDGWIGNYTIGARAQCEERRIWNKFENRWYDPYFLHPNRMVADGWNRLLGYVCRPN